MRTFRISCFAFLSVLSGALYGQDAVRVPLWPDDASERGPAEMFVYLPRGFSDPAAAVVVCPGGAYQGLAVDYEGHDAARWLAGRGVAAAVLCYRMPQGDPDIPLADVRRAAELMKERAQQWNIDTSRVGVMGFSAGGHLAATFSTREKGRLRPDFAVLFYPVIDLQDDSLAHAVSRSKLLGARADEALWRERYTLWRQVDSLTPPTLLLLSDDDRAVPLGNSVRYYSALKEHGVPAAMYVFPAGGHGWGFLPSFVFREPMKQLLEDWLARQGVVKRPEGKK